MQRFCCQRCGGSLLPSENAKTAVCESCGAVEVLPNTDISKYNEATRARLNYDYEQAAMLFQVLSTDDPKNSELHWNLALCHYGIEYQNDSIVFHRAVIKKFTDSEEYFAACVNATPETRGIYIAEGQRISEQQRLYWRQHSEVGNTDIVLCCTEKTKHMASQVSRLLVSEQYHVFSRLLTNQESLEEQNIRAMVALRSAKILLLFISSESEFQEKLIQRDYQLFQEQMLTDPQKRILPVAVNMEPQRLSKVFRGLQVQDASLLDFSANLIENINRYFNRRTLSPNISADVIPVLEVAKQLFLKGEVTRAASFFKEIVQKDPGCAIAWWYLFRIETSDMDVPTGAALFSDPLTEKAKLYRDAALKCAADDEKVNYVQSLETWKENIRKGRFEATWKSVKESIQNESDAPISIARNAPMLNDVYQYATADEKEKIYQYLFQHDWHICLQVSRNGENMDGDWSADCPEFKNALSFADASQTDMMNHFLDACQHRRSCYSAYRKIMDHLKQYFEEQIPDLPELQRLLESMEVLSGKIQHERKRHQRSRNRGLFTSIIRGIAVCALIAEAGIGVALLMYLHEDLFPAMMSALLLMLPLIVLITFLIVRKNRYNQHLSTFAQLCSDVMRLYDSEIDAINMAYEPQIGSSNVIRNYRRTKAYQEILVVTYKDDI